MKLVDVDELKSLQTYDLFRALEQVQPVKAIPLTEIEQLKEKIKQNAYPIVHGVNNHDIGMTLNGIFQALDELIEQCNSKEKEDGGLEK